MFEAAEGCHFRNARKQSELEAHHAHGESICSQLMAGDRSNDLQGCLLEGKVNTGSAKLPREQRVGVNTPMHARSCRGV